MSFKPSLHLTPASDCGHSTTTNRFTKFCRSLVRQSQWKSLRQIHCGSRMENPTHLATAELLRINIEKLDTDSMIYELSVCALSRSRSVAHEYTCEIVRIYSEETHPGYVKLIKEKDDTELLWSECVYQTSVLADGDPKHGPAFRESSKLHHFDTDYHLSNPTANVAGIKNLVITPQDLVFAVHSPYWPEEATEWVTRKRNVGVPSKSVILQAIAYGCDFVQVSHKFGDINEWRFSFSKAELLIIKSWTMCQRNVYTVLWLINKQIENSHMCTYYFKTIMLWACEEKLLKFWRHDLLVNTVCELLIYMMTSLKNKFCPNHFIPANNMMDHLVDTDLAYDIAAILKAVEKKEIFVSLVRSNMVLKSAETKCFELPVWIKRAVLLYNRINHEEDNFTDLNSSTFEPSIWNALQTELSDIHTGMHFQKLAMNFDPTLAEHKYNFKKSEMHLKRASSFWESVERDTWENCHHVIVRFIFNSFIVCENNEEQPEMNNYKCRKKTKSSFIKKEPQKSKPRDQKQSAFIRSTETWNFPMYPFSWHDVRCYGEWPGVSPTVNISWFIAKAYLANLYYTTNRDVRLVISTCDDIIDVYKQTYKNERFAERTFPVVLSTQWTGIYDERIQEMLEFYSLCKYVWTRSSSRSVYLGVCPVLFALYLKVRTMDFLKDMNNLFDHELKCKCNQKVNNGGQLILHCAIPKNVDRKIDFLATYYYLLNAKRQPFKDVNFNSK